MKKSFLRKKIHNTGISPSFLLIALFFVFGGVVVALPAIVQAAACSIPTTCLSPSSCAPGSETTDTCPAGQTCCTLNTNPPPPTPTPPPVACTGGTCVPGSCGLGSHSAGTCTSGTTCCIPNTTPPPPPSTTGGSGLVPCGFQDSPTAAEDCQFEDFIKLAKNFMNFLLFVIAVPIAAISFAWAGWLYLSAAGNEGNVKKAHEIFGYVVLGLCLALAAWLIVNAIVVGLGVGSKYNFLGTT